MRPAISKELHYLSFNAGRGEAWYRGHFPVLKPGERTIEASPFNMVDSNVPGRAARMLPEAHFIALVRNPVERAFSHYLHNLEHGLERLSFVEALDAEPERMRRAAVMGVDSKRGRSLIRACTYVHRGEYADRLALWFELIPATRCTSSAVRTCSPIPRTPTATCWSNSACAGRSRRSSSGVTTGATTRSRS